MSRKHGTKARHATRATIRNYKPITTLTERGCPFRLTAPRLVTSICEAASQQRASALFNRRDSEANMRGVQVGGH